MNEKKKFLLTIITECQQQKIKADKLSELIKNELGEEWEILNIENYSKFENSYKIELTKTFLEKKQEELNLLGISQTDKLVAPWLIYYDKEENSIELIFNKNENTQCRKIEFNVIKWGQLQITK